MCLDIYSSLTSLGFAAMLKDATLQVGKKPLCYQQLLSHKQGEEGEDRKYRSWMRTRK